MQPNPESCDLETNIPLLVRKEEYVWWNEVFQLTFYNAEPNVKIWNRGEHF